MHLETTFHIFLYLKNKHISTTVFDQTYSHIELDDFVECEWKGFFKDAEGHAHPNT